MISKIQHNNEIFKAADLIYITATDLFDMIFGRKKAVGSLFDLISEPGNMFNSEYVTVFKENNIVVGIIAGHSENDQKLIRAKEYKAFVNTIGCFKAIHYFKVIVPVLRRLTKYDLKEDEFYISNVGVDQKFRSRGIATQLIKYVIAEQQAKGIKKIYIDVEANNKNAVRLYESLGFKTERQKSIGLFGKKQTIFTMWMGL